MCMKYNRTPCMSCYVYVVNLELFPLAGYIWLYSYFLGTRFWNALDKITQDIPCIYAFTKHVNSLYKKYNALYGRCILFIACMYMCDPAQGKDAARWGFLMLDRYY